MVLKPKEGGGGFNEKDSE